MDAVTIESIREEIMEPQKFVDKLLLNWNHGPKPGFYPRVPTEEILQEDELELVGSA